jgi:hypothetical protein
VCCQSPLEIIAPLYPFDVTPIVVVYTGQPPIDERGPISFDLSTRLRP